MYLCICMYGCVVVYVCMYVYVNVCAFVYMYLKKCVLKKIHKVVGHHM